MNAPKLVDGLYTKKNDEETKSKSETNKRKKQRKPKKERSGNAHALLILHELQTTNHYTGTKDSLTVSDTFRITQHSDRSVKDGSDSSDGHGQIGLTVLTTMIRWV